jgi:hypothetical protein
LKSACISDEHVASVSRVEEHDKQETSLLAVFFILVAFLISSNLKMEATSSYETHTDFQQNTEDGTLHKHLCGSINSYMINKCLDK